MIVNAIDGFYFVSAGVEPDIPDLWAEDLHEGLSVAVFPGVVAVSMGFDDEDERVELHAYHWPEEEPTNQLKSWRTGGWQAEASARCAFREPCWVVTPEGEPLEEIAPAGDLEMVIFGMRLDPPVWEPGEPRVRHMIVTWPAQS